MEDSTWGTSVGGFFASHAIGFVELLFVMMGEEGSFSTGRGWMDIFFSCS